MLSIYRRHRLQCKQAADRISKQCRCPLWATGTLEGKPYRKSLKTRSFERAEQIKREIETGSEQPPSKSVTIDHAFQSFIADCESRNLNPATLRKYRLLRDRLSRFLQEEGVSHLHGVQNDLLRRFRGQRELGARTAAKELERVKSFFRFCVQNGWLQTSPAQTLKAPEIKPNPTLPFTDAEVSKILANTDHRSAIFFRVLLHSGLRIIDAAQLRPEKIIAGKLFLYTQKTGVPVMIPIPPDLLADLEKLPLVGGFFFAVESDNPVTIAEYYRVKLKTAAKTAGINNAHPHRFRDTFAVRLLEKGVPLETVSILLGHTDIKTTQRSYAPWVQSLQRNLEIAVQKTWSSKLVRVK